MMLGADFKDDYKPVMDAIKKAVKVIENSEHSLVIQKLDSHVKDGDGTNWERQISGVISFGRHIDSITTTDACDLNTTLLMSGDLRALNLIFKIYG
ncbi:hypothetical protein PTKIN_Ptkin08bG0093000 [Pterospermum kingtungense]